MTGDRVPFIRKYWFLVGMILVAALTLADTSETIARAGRWFKDHQGPNAAIALVFLFSGLILNIEQIKAGLRDLKGLLVALGLIFIAAPLLALALVQTPMETGMLVGLVLVAVMPTTLSSGVVMTGAAGGNMAHALVITIVANAVAIVTIPLWLNLLLNSLTGSGEIDIDEWAIVVKLATLVLLPLTVGLLVKGRLSRIVPAGRLAAMQRRLQMLNQAMILFIVWMGVSQGRETIFGIQGTLFTMAALVVVFHVSLLLVAAVAVGLFKLGRGRRESVIFMGCQKTLPLCIMLQVSLFPQYGQALVVCILHHFLHLMIDGYLVERLKPKSVGLKN